MQGSIIELSKGDTRSLDYDSYTPGPTRHLKPSPACWPRWYQLLILIAASRALTFPFELPQGHAAIYIALPYLALHCIALYDLTLPYITWHYVALQSFPKL